MTTVKFNGRFSMVAGDNVEYVKDVPAKVRELLAKGIKINIKESASTVRPLLTELISFPLPEEQEPKMVTRHVLRTKGGKRSFVSKEKAEDYYNRYCARFDYPWGMEITPVEVNA